MPISRLELLRRYSEIHNGWPLKKIDDRLNEVRLLMPKFFLTLKLL